MIIKKKNRKFRVGLPKNKISLTEVAHIFLKKDEMVTFFDQKLEYDFVKKNWGYYCTPSINSRLKKFGYKVAIVSSVVTNNIFILAVDKKKIKQFNEYKRKEKLRILKWLS
jgi:hypothetical protein